MNGADLIAGILKKEGVEYIPAFPHSDIIDAAARAGIRPIMITGDHPLTARHIAQEVGITADEPSLAGVDLEAVTRTLIEVFAEQILDDNIGKVLGALDAAGREAGEGAAGGALQVRVLDRGLRAGRRPAVVDALLRPGGTRCGPRTVLDRRPPGVSLPADLRRGRRSRFHRQSHLARPKL